MKKIIIATFIVAGMIAAITGCKKTEYRALIITGQNPHHNWKASFPVLKTILDGSGLFTTDVSISPEQGKDMSRFKPVFSKYQVVVVDYCGDSWPEETKKAFTDYVSNGGGVVIYHGSSIAFPDWKEYNEMSGLGGSTGTHASRREFEIRTRNSEHPIMKGLPARWLHGSDELYSSLRGPGKNMEILATANSDSTGRGRGRDEPVLMAIGYGKGRVFHTAIGHADEGGGAAMKCVGFIATLQRGAEWAASGTVTQPVPNDFPTASGVVTRSDFRPLTLEEDFLNLSNYEIGKSTRYLTDIQARISQASGDPVKLLEIEKMMVGLLKKSEATVEGKKLILRELSWMGTEYCYPAIKDAATIPDLKDDAYFAIERLNIK